MQGYLSLVLHAHLPFVRHPEHDKFLEENWLFEAITETYIPLLQTMERWLRDGMDTRLTLTLTPTLCSMLRDPLLQDRYVRHLGELIELAEKEIHRTRWDKPFHELACLYHRRFLSVRDSYFACGRNLVAAFRQFQELEDRDHHQRRHARAAAVAGRPSALDPRADVGRAGSLPRAASAAIRGASGCRNAPMWTARRRCCRRPTSAGL